jgi:ectoine hydroxylase-related dioxygenase (phytanoyl-CoA dioxygenase family)
MTTQKPFITTQDCNIRDFKSICEQNLQSSDVPLSVKIEKNIPIYDGNLLEINQQLLAEWAYVLRQSSGVIVIKNAVTDHEAIDEATAVYYKIIAEEKAAGAGAADHFAAAGSNDRIWNSLQKLALEAPNVFARYFANPLVDAASRAWLGPNYQMTAQVNLVHPGGKAQKAHRDYHLGFQTPERSAQYPAHVHDLSPVMTLQGALAHTDMPIESGPTKLLPFSQSYHEGYLAYHLPEFTEYFEENYVQLELKKGDAVFFNPALFHAAGDNNSQDVKRFVNLLQVSSAFGRAMESVDRFAMCEAIYPELLKLNLEAMQQEATIASTAEGYSFPTNLDRDPPIGGLAPKTQADIMRQCLKEQKSSGDFNIELEALLNRQRP